ncbi:MAG TPA: hypothetical protein VGL81_08045 [Polyangiaceae bacterium]|jgi:DNA-directed RNA polymerase specialized sigma24 family protein
MPDDSHDPDDDRDEPANDERDEPAAADDDDDDEIADQPDPPVAGDDPAAPPLDPAVVRRYLGTRKAMSLAKNIVGKIVPRSVVQELAADALVRALTAPPPRKEVVLPGWLAAIAWRTAVRWLEKEARRAPYIGEMPIHVAREDDYTGEAIDEEGVGHPSYDPTRDDEPAGLLGAHLRSLIGDNVRDLQVLAMILEHVEDDRPYPEIAKSRNLTEDQVAGRIKRFKVKYGKPVHRRREWMVILKWLVIGAVGIAAGFLLLRWLRHPTDDIRPDPSLLEPRPSPSASASTPVFLQALPPPTEPSANPEKKPERLKP